jgi:hypothetical protein
MHPSAPASESNERIPAWLVLLLVAVAAAMCWTAWTVARSSASVGDRPTASRSSDVDAVVDAADIDEATMDLVTSGASRTSVAGALPSGWERSAAGVLMDMDNGNNVNVVASPFAQRLDEDAARDASATIRRIYPTIDGFDEPSKTRLDGREAWKLSGTMPAEAGGAATTLTQWYVKVDGQLVVATLTVIDPSQGDEGEQLIGQLRLR